MRQVCCVVSIVAFSGLAVAQDCPSGIGFVSGQVTSMGSGNVVFDGFDDFLLSYDCCFYARVETDNGSGEIEGAVSTFQSSSSYRIFGFTGDFEQVSADVIINIPQAVQYFVSSNASAIFEPGGESPGQIDPPGDEGTLTAGTYRVSIVSAYAGSSFDWELILEAPFETISPPCVADLAVPCGVLDFSDAMAFLTAFGAMEAAADLAAPKGVWDYSDVFAYLVAYGDGCP